jgi:hypothetical protein
MKYAAAQVIWQNQARRTPQAGAMPDLDRIPASAQARGMFEKIIRNVCAGMDPYARMRKATDSVNIRRGLRRSVSPPPAVRRETAVTRLDKLLGTRTLAPLPCEHASGGGGGGAPDGAGTSRSQRSTAGGGAPPPPRRTTTRVHLQADAGGAGGGHSQRGSAAGGPAGVPPLALDGVAAPGKGGPGRQKSFRLSSRRSDREAPPASAASSRAQAAAAVLREMERERERVAASSIALPSRSVLTSTMRLPAGLSDVFFEGLRDGGSPHGSMRRSGSLPNLAAPHSRAGTGVGL